MRITAALMTVSLLFRWASAQPPKPQPIAIYYGYPSLVNGAKGDLDKAARAFDAYSILVIGDRLELPDGGRGADSHDVLPGHPSDDRDHRYAFQFRLFHPQLPQ